MAIKSRIILGLALFVASFGYAAPVNLTSYATITPSNSSAASLESFLNSSITGYNAANNPDLPSPAGAQVFRINKDESANGAYPTFPTFPGDTLSLTLPMGFFNYLVLHWGGPGGGVYQSFYLGGDTTGTANFLAPSRNGLSSYSLFSTVAKPTPTPPPPPSKVPDAGSTLLLSGLALAGIGFFRRR